MANIKNTFLSGVETLFSVFEEAVNTGTYSIETDDGFTDTATTESDSIRCIFEKFTAEDIDLLGFGSLIQPQDIKGLMPYVDLVNCEMSTKGTMLFGSDTYTVEGHDVDSMNVIFTLLLRKV